MSFRLKLVDKLQALKDKVDNYKDTNVAKYNDLKYKDEDEPKE